MKVRCISRFQKNPKHPNAPIPEVGDVDEVLQEVNFFGYEFYALERFGFEWVYIAKYFAIVPDIDDNELVENEVNESMRALVDSMAPHI